MTDRLFDLDGIPEVPLLREPPPGRGALIMDEWISHHYPPEWSRCPECSAHGYRWTRDGGRSFAYPNYASPPDEIVGVGNNEGPWEKVPCPKCLGMGSVKAMVRLLADHRCERCHHPYMPKGDAKILGVPPSGVGGEHMGGRWSACDPHCAHLGPIRWRDAAERDASDLDGWKYQDLDAVGQSAGDRILDYGPSGEPVWRYDVEAEWRILTVHHLDGDKANLAWWNLAALCQRCHLEIQAKVLLERVYAHEHSAWFAIHAAGYYASVYEGRQITREEAESRLDELLAYERVV